MVDRPLGFDSPFLEVLETQQQRDVSRAAQYARQAVESLGKLSLDAAVYCFSGPSGAHVAQFDRACDDDGKLLTAGFAESRARRIHPFTLLLALQNQVPAVLSMSLQLRGPCLSIFESAISFATIFPLAVGHLAAGRSVLVVLSSAAGEAEERARTTLFRQPRECFEGAVAMRLGTSNGLGRLGSGVVGDSVLDLWNELAVYEPVLMPGISILMAMVGKQPNANIVLRDDSGGQGRFSWEAV